MSKYIILTLFIILLFFGWVYIESIPLGLRLLIKLLFRSREKFSTYEDIKLYDSEYDSKYDPREECIEMGYPFHFCLARERPDYPSNYSGYLLT